MVHRRIHSRVLPNLLFTLDRSFVMELKDYQIEIINRALSLLSSNYDRYDLEELMYSGLELESEIHIIQEKLETRLIELYKKEVKNG
tara:strand:- start:519 stop:779 length:261 start_codon:yes stop_codon:yes gene_type:complete